MTSPASSSAAYQRAPGVLFTSLGDEFVLMSAERGAYFSLNAVGSRIWERLAEPISLPRLCDELLREFDVPRERCEIEVMEFVGRLQAAGLVTTRDA